MTAKDLDSRLEAFWNAVDLTPCPADAERLFDRTTPAGALRRSNLLRYLTLCAEAGSHTFLVAEAPGWRGMSNTGVPFMGVRELDARPGLLTGEESGDGFEIPPEPTAPWEASSRVVQAALAGLDVPPPVSWPVYPHHPFVAGDRLTNRTPRPTEVRSGIPAVRTLMEAFEIRQVIAVGRKAEGALALIGMEATAVRHPAQGGAAQFTEQVRAVLSAA